MEALLASSSLADTALLLGLSTTRVAVAFLLVPLFTSDIVPALVRNAMFVSIALLTVLLQPAAKPLVLTTWQWLTLFGKEAMIGAGLGFMFASIMWAFEIAGQIIDNKVGTTQAQIVDPLSGHQTSLNGAFFARLASWVFMASGGFMVMVAAMIESYAIWPVQGSLPNFQTMGLRVFESEFGRIMLLAVLISAPAIVLLCIIDGVLGLINRFAQQLNVFSLSMSLKAVASTWIILVQVAVMAEFLREDLLGRGGVVLETLRRIFGG